ncbi:MAG TPA: hypothetical protein VHF89_15190 [Solirubrobacteraceae bacterium]|nr:hypothetical protein [Solirubrobacteraceae bacterium]
MHPPSADLPAESAQLLAAALAVEAMAGSADASTAPGVLHDLQAVVTALAGACDEIATGLVPPGGTICERYARAAAAWSSSGETPSHERFAFLLAALHDAAGGLRAASERCRVAAAATRPIVAA